MPHLTTAHWLSLHGLVTVVALLIYVLTAHVFEQRRPPAAAIAWVLFMLLLPYVALPAFLLFGSRKLPRPRMASALVADSADSPLGWAERTALALGQPAPAGYRDLHVHADGEAALAALWEVLDGARHSIDCCTFILGRDHVGSEVVRRLAEKARAGLRVRLLLDGVGRLMGSRADLQPLRDAGAELSFFVAPLRSPLKGRTNLRNHRKMLLADADAVADPRQARLWCGGRNLAAEYFDGMPGHTPWRDLSFDVRGDIVRQGMALFEHDWAFAMLRRLPTPPWQMLATAPAAPLTFGTQAAPEAPLGTPRTPDTHGTPGPPVEPRAQLIASGPDQVEDTLQAMFISAAYRARSRLRIATPYFVPDTALLSALTLAARRGVRIELLLPARSNHRLSDLARRRALRSLHAAGGELWLAPQMLHAKLVVVDDELALAGSANLDGRSLLINYELMMAFHDRAAVDAFADWFDRERAPASICTPQGAGLVSDLLEGLLLWVGFQL